MVIENILSFYKFIGTRQAYVPLRESTASKKKKKC